MAEEFTKNEYFRNRELSWIQFDDRILSEAKDTTLPLLERIKFLSITASNLDEFFMVRVASLKDQVHANYKKEDIAGMRPAEQLEQIGMELHRFVADQYQTYQDLLPLLEAEGLYLVPSHESLSTADSVYVDQYFMDTVYPVLTPMAVDSSRPFPLIRNKSLNIAALILSKKEKKAEPEFATVQVPSVLPRLVQIPTTDGSTRLILLEEIIERNIQKLFLNYDVVCAHPYRIERNSDLGIDEEDAEDLLKEIQRSLKRRQWGEAIKLEIDAGVDKKLLCVLKKELEIKDEDVYLINGPLDLTFLWMDLKSCVWKSISPSQCRKLIQS